MNRTNNNLLLQAAERGNLLRVQELLKVEGGADIQAKDDHGWTALHFACKNGDLEVVKWLVEQGANIHATNNCGKAPCFYTSSSDDKNGLQIQEIMVKSVQDSTTPNKRRKKNDTIIALNSTPALVNSSPDSEDRSNANISEGNTPTICSAPIFPDAVLSEEDERKFLLHCAVKYGDLDVIKDVLLQDCVGDADKNAVDSNGRAAIDLAALTGQLDVLKLLAENGCKHNKEPKPKMIAICKKRQPLAKKYLEQVVESL